MSPKYDFDLIEPDRNVDTRRFRRPGRLTSQANHLLVFDHSNREENVRQPEKPGQTRLVSQPNRVGYRTRSIRRPSNTQVLVLEPSPHRKHPKGHIQAFGVAKTPRFVQQPDPSDRLVCVQWSAQLDRTQFVDRSSRTHRSASF